MNTEGAGNSAFFFALFLAQKAALARFRQCFYMRAEFLRDCAEQLRQAVGP
jgi:hypothetical protein